MQDDIDLAKYLRPIFRHFPLGFLLFAIIAGAVIGAQLLRQPAYRASATLFSSAAEYQWRFDSRISPNIEVNKNWAREFSELAKDPWLQATIASTINPGGGGHLDGSVSVRAGKQTLLFVDAIASSPAKAAQLANQWAEAYVAWANKMYGASVYLAQMSEEFAQVEKTYRQALETMREFQARTGIGIAAEGQTMLEGYEWYGPLGLELAQKNRLLAGHRLAVTNLEAVLGQLRSAKDVREVSWGLLDLPSISARGQVTTTTYLDYVGRPAELEALLMAELTAQQRGVQALEKETVEDQKMLTTLLTEFNRLVEERNLTKENYQTFRRKLDEIRVQSKIESVELRIISPAQAPTSPVPISWPLTAALALVAGGVVGVAGCYVAEWIEARRRRQ